MMPHTLAQHTYQQSIHATAEREEEHLAEVGVLSGAPALSLALIHRVTEKDHSRILTVAITRSIHPYRGV
jgi:hypothetical protein